MITVARRLDLEGGVLDVEMVSQASTELIQHRPAQCLIADDNVS